jgi:type IV pilus assembly protein PilE
MRTATLHKSRAAGFTLIELMTTILIATILIVIAVPSYTNQMRQSRRTDARTALLDLAQREERYLSTNNAYTGSAGYLGYATSAGTPFPQTVSNNDYTLNVCLSATTTPPAAPCTASAGAGVTGLAYTITATAVNSQAKDTTCATLSVDNTGNQTATNSNCWTN